MKNAKPERLGERVLVLAPMGRDATLTQAMLLQNGFSCDICAGMEQLCVRLSEGAGAVIVAQEALDGPSARRLVQTLLAEAKWSDPPLILFASARGGSDGYQGSVDLLGKRANLTILERPVRKLTLLSAVRSALSARRRQYEVRDLLLRLEKAVEERDRFLATLSHELRNPLGTIRNALAIAEQAEDGLGREQRQIIVRQTCQLSRLVDDLLDVSRVTAGKIVLQRVATDLARVVQRSIESAQAALRSQGHELTLSLCSRAVFVMGDPARLEQVVTNLLTNAIKYTPAGGRIGVSLDVEGTSAVIRVRDNGIGLSPEMLPRLFEPFMQVDQSLDRSQGGLGLGLTLVRSLVEMHRGTVTATSDGLGLGSAFAVRLPMVEAPSSAAVENQQARAQVSHRILVVEDGADARKVMHRLLTFWGHQVEVAEDGLQGVEKAIALRPDVVLVDIGLPILSGFEVAKKIRAALDGSVYLVALTGYGQPEDRQRTKDAGFDVHLVKPVEPEVLCQLLARRGPDLANKMA